MGGPIGEASERGIERALVGSPFKIGNESNLYGANLWGLRE